MASNLTKTKWLKDPTCAIFSKMIWLKDVKYDDGGWISDASLKAMHQGWCTNLMHQTWCTEGDAPDVMHHVLSMSVGVWCMSGGVWWSSLSSLLSPSSPSYPVSCVPSVPFKSFEKSWEFWGSEIPLLGPTCQVHLVLDAIASPSSYPCGWVGQSVSGWVGGVIAVHTSDPLLDVVEWMSYSTEVSCFH